MLVDAAIELLYRRFPNEEGVAAAMYTADGEILTSVYFRPAHDSAVLCAETGAICEAEKLGKSITASVCVSRRGPKDPIRILAPCGICRERLFRWGRGVEVAVPYSQTASKWMAKTLDAVHLYYWADVFFMENGPDGSIE